MAFIATVAQSCGAHSVGEPLPRPENELTFLWALVAACCNRPFAVLVFLSQTILALVQDSSRAATSQLALSRDSSISGHGSLRRNCRLAFEVGGDPRDDLVVFGSRQILSLDLNSRRPVFAVSAMLARLSCFSNSPAAGLNV